LKLLDTNTVIHYLQGRGPVVAAMKKALRQELRLPSVVAYELAYGTLKSGSDRRKRALEAIFTDLLQVPFDSSAAAEAARIRVELEGRGFAIGPLDLMIAATALSIGATLVTNNTREFSRIKRLRLEDWTK
jgi:tRNA(fMet)-specific endonuclease VapC